MSEGRLEKMFFLQWLEATACYNFSFVFIEL